MLFRISIGGHTAILHDWEPLYPDAQRVKRVGAVGTALQLVLFGLRKFFTALIFLAILDTGRGDGNEQIRIVVPVDEHQVVGTATEHAVDKVILQDVVHRLTDILGLHVPSLATQARDDHSIESLGMGAIAVAHEGGIVVEHYLMATVIAIVVVEIIKQFRDTWPQTSQLMFALASKAMMSGN